MAAKREALLGLGANIGRPIEQLGAALARLGQLLEGMRVSSVYRTAPVGYADQPDFYNCACIGSTLLEPLQLFRETQRIEARLGRERRFLYAPRTIDIDILAMGDVVMSTPQLVLPHPRLHERAFVLVPVAEVAPEWRHPAMGLTAAELLERSGRLERVERVGAAPLA